MKEDHKSSVTVQLDIHRDIIEKSKRGDMKSQYQLYQQYSGAMYNICLRMMRKREEAEDMLQESFSEAFHKLHTFRYDSTFGAWIKRIVVNKCINELKRRRASLEFFDDMEPFNERGEEEEVPAGLSVEQVKKAMEHLPNGSKMIFSLYLLEGYDHTEISQILNISESNSKSQYMRAKRKMKEVLNKLQHEH